MEFHLTLRELPIVLSEFFKSMTALKRISVSEQFSVVPKNYDHTLYASFACHFKRFTFTYWYRKGIGCYKLKTVIIDYDGLSNRVIYIWA